MRREVRGRAKSHLAAVAVGYNEQDQRAPEILTKGYNSDVSKMKKLARRYGIPIKSSSMLTKKLSELEVSSEVPRELYKDVAKVFCELVKSEKKPK